MVQRRYYRVAGLSFSVTAEAEQFTWLDKYVLFSVPEEEAQERLFDLCVSSDVATTEEAEYVYSDTPGYHLPRIEVYRLPNSGEWLFCLAENKNAPVRARLSASADFSTASLQIMDSVRLSFALDTAAMLLFAFTSARYDTLLMHSSVIVRGGQGYMFLGRSGTGKSTHSRLWLDVFPDAWLLNDDNPVLRVADGEVRVYGSPWSGKTPCYHSVSIPVGGMVQLKQAPANTMHQLRLPEAYGYIFSSCSGLKIAPDMMDAIHRSIALTLESVPVYLLDCLPDTNAVRLCHDTLTQ